MLVTLAVLPAIVKSALFEIDNIYGMLQHM
jgi:hypothetical protein